MKSRIQLRIQLYWHPESCQAERWANEHSSSALLLLVQKVRYSCCARQRTQTCSASAHPAQPCQSVWAPWTSSFPPRNSLQPEWEDFLCLCHSLDIEEAHQRFLARAKACAVGKGHQVWNLLEVLGLGHMETSALCLPVVGESFPWDLWTGAAPHTGTCIRECISVPTKSFTFLEI